MLAKRLESLQHPIVKDLVKLRKERKYRREKNSVLIVGFKQVIELNEHVPLQILLMEDGTQIPPSLRADEIYIVTKAILKKITALENPEPIAAVAALPREESLLGKRWLLALDGISDPGNLGTLIRTALALGWEGIFLLPGTTDPFNEKALRAAKGATFRIPLKEGTADELDSLIKNNKMHVYAACSKGTPIDKEKISPPVLLILGNESQGITTILETPSTQLGIPIQEMESLNVAAAGAIMMYQLKGKK